jgi:predicted O-methyltransferase YrrM
MVLVEQPARFVLSGGPPMTGMASDPRTVDFLCGLALFIGARTVVEAGTHQGHTALALGAALLEAGLGSHVWTADIEDCYPKGIMVQAVDPLGLTGTVSCFHGDFVDMLGGIPYEVDLAYIDASSVERPLMRREHFEAVWPRMRQGGLVVIDDCGWDGGAFFRDRATLYLPQHRGLVICQKNDYYKRMEE